MRLMQQDTTTLGHEDRAERMLSMCGVPRVRCVCLQQGRHHPLFPSVEKRTVSFCPAQYGQQMGPHMWELTASQLQWLPGLSSPALFLT